MNFDALLDQAIAMLQRRGRLTYRALKLQFQLDEEHLDALKEELLYAYPQVTEDAGRGLIWAEQEALAPAPRPPLPQAPTPASYTPAHLAERIRAEQAALEARSGTDGERKVITALFADLKGSTALIEGLDPEEARAIIDPALQLMMDAVHRYEGYVAQALGDGIFALFGAPLAHEDHPQRALYAALRMQDEMRRYADTLRQKGYPPLLMRVGVNTGEVVIRSIRKDDLHTDYSPVGHSVHLAARMEQLAAPGSILVTDYTHRLTDGYFAFKDLGPTQIKGVEEPLTIFEVLGVGALRTRLQVAAQRGLTRFVGRQSELEQLQHALEQAKGGHGQIVGVMGEPGLGKSRLFYEFKLLAHSGCLTLEAYSVSHGKASAYLPVLELLKGYFRIEPPDDERVRREKVIGRVLGLDRTLEDTLPYLFTLLGIEEQPSSLPQMDAQIRRRRTFEALKKLFLRESLNQPLTLIFEDLHWIDSETQGFLDGLSESVASVKILLLTNYRPEYRHEWGQKTYYTQLHLAPLGKAEAEELLTVLLGNDASLTSVKAIILEKTEGTPFFLEEVVQTLVEDATLSGEPGHYHLTHHAPTFHLPPTVQGVLAARIDRLTPDEKGLLQQLAVIGRQFPLSLVRHVLPQPEEELYRLLSALQHKEFLYEQPAFPEPDYLFKHALTQEVAYGSVLQERRKALHERTAQAMEALYPENLGEYYSELAHHYTHSGNTEKAVTYLHKAGQQAAQRSANAEAINHLTKGLALLKALPDTSERAHQELLLHVGLGVPLQILKGEPAPEVGRTYHRILELSGQVGDTTHRFPALFGLWRFSFLRADLQKAGELAAQMLHLAEHSHDPALLLEAHRALGTGLFLLGDLRQGHRHLEQGIALYDIQQHRAHAFLYGIDPGVYCRCVAAWDLWCLGYPEQALKNMEDALRLAREVAHPHTLMYALLIATYSYQFRHEGTVVREQAEALLTLAAEQGFAFRATVAIAMRGWALAAAGQLEAGVAQMQEGLASLRTTGSEAVTRYYAITPYFLALLAETYGKMGRAGEGLNTLAVAVAAVERTGERWYEAELYRLKGELTLNRSSVPGLEASVQQEAEACLHKAIEIARKQQAKSLELRATMSLARLWQQQGKKEEAHRLLSTIYDWFTEGFDTEDLQEAKALLDALAGGR